MSIFRNRQWAGRMPQISHKFSGIGGIDSYTKLMMHFDNYFVDEVAPAVNVVTINGATTTDATQSVFGGASAKFVAASSQRFRIPDSDDWNFGTGSFTIDFRIRYATLPATTAAMAICGQYVDVNTHWYCQMRNAAGVYQMRIYGLSGGVTCTSGLITTNPNLAVDTWYHFACVKNGNDFMWFQNGTQIGVSVTDTDPMPDIAAQLMVGDYGAGTMYLNGWIDEFRISKGIARWTSNFTIPATAYTKKSWT